MADENEPQPNTPQAASNDGSSSDSSDGVLAFMEQMQAKIGELSEKIDAVASIAAECKASLDDMQQNGVPFLLQ
jgi:hypothetical protein